MKIPSYSDYSISYPQARYLFKAFYLHLRMTGWYLYCSVKNASPLPSFLSGGQTRNDDGRKEYNMTLSEESGSD